MEGGGKVKGCINFYFFFFNDTATTEIYTLSLHDALPISWGTGRLTLLLLVGGVVAAFPVPEADDSLRPGLEIGRAHV